jgi:hypothetical protein
LNRLFRRREVWLPTRWGWLLLILIAVLIVLALGHSVPFILAPDAPARGPGGHGARTLVVEGWLSRPELAQAVDLIRRGQYERVLTSGGPIEPEIDVGDYHSFAQRAAAYLKAHGPADVPVIAVPAPATLRNRTYLSARVVRDWAQQSGVSLDAIDVYSAGAHARRSRLLYRLAFGNSVEVGVMAARPGDYDIAQWWTSFWPEEGK